MINNLKFMLFPFMLLVLSTELSYASSGTEIMQKATNNVYYQGKDQRMEVHMLITDSQNRKRIREFSLLRRNMESGAGEQKYYVYFQKPSDVKKMVFMAWKHLNKDDDRWLYLPALDLVKRIAASDERTSFVGSHFFYEDVSGRGIDEDTHTLADENETQYIINSIPKNPDSVEFTEYKVWIDKKTFLPMIISYFKDSNQPYRTYTTLAYAVIDGHTTVTKAQMEDHISGGKTIINYTSIHYSIGIPVSIFSERYLRRKPNKYIQ